MPRGDKSKYTDKQERKADHIAEGYEKRGVSEKEAERRAWATVNKDDGGPQEGSRFRPRQAYGPSRRSQGRGKGRQGGGLPVRGRALGLSEEGGRDAQAQWRSSCA